MASIGFDAIGTQWRIETDVALSPALRRRVDERIAGFDRVWSRFRADTLVAQMANAPVGGTFHFPDEAGELFELFDMLHQMTDSAVDPLVGGDLELLGYDAIYSLTPGASPLDGPRPAWSRDVQRDGAALVTHRPLVLDVGAAGKGLLVDYVTQILVDSGMQAIAVDAGGDMRLVGAEPVVIGLEHPFDPTLAIGVVEMGTGALCASAVGRRAWGDGLHHVLDGRTGHPTRDVVATWVRADTAMVADGLATALFFVPPRNLAGSFAFSYARMFADGRAEISSCFGGELFID
ncbi:FAD:protein FMN transferase [Sphingomonas phyllosphaerae]|uniref:FAD:protein FMN transferase n=1 Tax=Sphingomonas phyllosphaerae TaxID=257003 RepID=UPI0004007C1C|nr:FAD:protein FMN transferase [Sphingomonas phyllosphaerae]